MPGLVRKILIFAAADGLILQPLAQRGQRPAPASKITYGDKHIETTTVRGDAGGQETGKSFEAFGIVGLLTVSKSSFLISITRRQQVAQIQGKPIYVVTEVAITPLSSKVDAELSIGRTFTSLQKRTVDRHESDDSDTEEDEADISANASDDVDDEDVRADPTDSSSVKGKGSMERKRNTSVAEDVMARKGSYGRFAQKWFSKKGWTVDQRRNLGMSVNDPGTDTPKQADESGDANRVSQKDSAVDGAINTKNVKEQKASDVAANLLPKLLRTTQILFGSSRSFFFSYDFDITRSLASRRTAISELPLYKEVDPLFFWNRNLMQPFIDSGQVALALPLLQGFVGQRTFEVDPHPPEPALAIESAAQSSTLEMTDFSEAKEGKGTEGTPDDRSSGENRSTKFYLLTLISRRSIKRAGLRYLRRGVDEQGNTANFVETEQTLSDPAWAPSSKIYSFVQIRGSVPIYWTQSPYSFKPVPQIQHSEETNFSAFKAHFNILSDRYGAIQVASLVEKHGPEAIVGEAYEKNMTKLNGAGGINGSTVGFEWFDFHAVCRGMHYEKVTLLMESLEKRLDKFGYSVEVDGKLLVKQSGILRTNCMDCLDRTNVVQSACGRRALEVQLSCEGIDLNAQADQNTEWFNTIWADNGDGVSKQYASTAALKGDFTRTRKRDYKGALTDMGLSISRFYSGIVNDYFSQAAIDFLVGNVTSLVFEDFEANMMSGDPAISMQRMRQQAIEVSQKLVIADEQEEFISGWTLLAPSAPNTIKSMPFEETVLLLTDAALYTCRFDWDTEKVSSFERIDLTHILNIKYGTYITSTLSAAQADPTRNVGFVITYKAGSEDITRVNTRSLSTVQSQDSPSDGKSIDPSDRTPASPPAPIKALTNLFQAPSAPTPPTRILAFKALYARSALADDTSTSRVSEIEQVMTVCFDIERMVLTGQVVEAGSDKKMSIVEEGEIISLADARKSTSVFEQLGYNLKRMVWA